MRGQTERLARGGPIDWAARHPVVPNLIMIALVIGGLLAIANLRKEVFPQYDGLFIQVVVPLPGATPEEVVDSVLTRIEGPVSRVHGVGEITGHALDGRGELYFSVEDATSPDATLSEVQQAIRGVTTLPDDIERPIVRLNVNPKPIVDIHVHGDVDPVSLRRAAEIVEDRLLLQPEISTVAFKGAPDHEVIIEVPRTMLRAMGVTLGELALSIRQATEERSGGRISTTRGALQLRVDSSPDGIEALRRLPLVTGEDGAILRLGDVAEIRRGFEEQNVERWFNGQRSVMMEILRVGEETPLGIAAAAKRAVADAERVIPEAIGVTIANDRSTLFEDRVNLLLRNGFVGLSLVLLLLSAFLEIRLAFWVAVGIPTAFLGAFLLLPAADVTINMVSLFAFIVALGLVVDDAIVAGENIYEYRERGLAPVEAAVQGARDIAMPLSFSIITNIIAFIPLAMVPGWFGRFFYVIPVVVAAAFIVSWLEALFVLPGHLAAVKQRERRKRGLARLRHTLSDGLGWFISRLYEPLLRVAVSWRYTTIALMIAILAVTSAYPLSGRMGFNLFPPIPRDVVRIQIGIDQRSPLEVRERLLRKVLAAIDAVAEEHGGDKLVRHVETVMRKSKLQIRAYLTRPSIRPLESTEFAEAVRDKLGTVPEARWTDLAARFGGGSDEVGVRMMLIHPQTETLRLAVEDLRETLRSFEAIKSTNTGFSLGPEQLSFRVTEAGRAMGFTASNVGEQVRHAFLGAEAYRDYENGNELTYRLLLPKDERRSEYDISTLILRAPDGREAPLFEIAEVTRRRVEGNINRWEGRRSVHVGAKLSPPELESQIVGALERDILPELGDKFPGLTVRFDGHENTKRETLESFVPSITIALLLMYAALAIPFRSWIQPLIVMAAIPFGFAGAIIGHLIMGMWLSVISIFGVIALGGVVINAALVMIDYANKARAVGASHEEAIIRAGTRRFRPILLTTLTTFGGLAPMIFETSAQARFLVPMAVSLGYGILFATFIVLFLIPCLYMMVEDLRWLANPKPRERVRPAE
ncbi:MAG: efflux RND transporter permease subunit [Pseudomonadota bacterium]